MLDLPIPPTPIPAMRSLRPVGADWAHKPWLPTIVASPVFKKARRLGFMGVLALDFGKTRTFGSEVRGFRHYDTHPGGPLAHFRHSCVKTRHEPQGARHIFPPHGIC